jgi:hypothetical protein
MCLEGKDGGEEMRRWYKGDDAGEEELERIG